MTWITDESDNLVPVEEQELYITVKDMNRIFELADKIAQIEVRYDPDPLVMANNAIKDMQKHASEIAALAIYK